MSRCYYSYSCSYTSVTVNGTNYSERIYGNCGDDYLYGNGGNDRMYGGRGDDQMYGGSGCDRLYGGSGKDELYGGSGHDYLYGGYGRDELFGGSGCDVLYGGRNDDRLTGGSGNDVIYGGCGTDTAVFSGSVCDYTVTTIYYWCTKYTKVVGPDGTDYLHSVEKLEFDDITIDLKNNNAALAKDDAFEVNEDDVLVISDADLTANDFDWEGDDLSIVSVSSSDIDVTRAPDGTITITPGAAYDYLATGETATATVSYVVEDEHGAQSTGTATITIIGEDEANVGPVAQDDALTVGESGFVLGDVLGNDTDADGDALMITSANGTPVETPFSVTSAGGRVGTAIVSADGVPNIVFDTAANFEDLGAGETDTVEITYEISDGNGGTSSATVTITVEGENDGPVAVADALSVSESGFVLGDVLGNDTDVDGDALMITSANGTPIETPFSVTSVGGRVGTAIVSADGVPNIVFDTAAGFEDLGEGETDTVEITYEISDGNGGTSSSTVTITVNGENDGPVAAADALSVSEDGFVLGDVLGNDTDVDGDALMITSANGNPIETPFTVVSAGGREGTAIVSADGVPNIVFDTASNFDDMSDGDTDTVEITYEISDGNGGTSSSTVTITVNGVNDDPDAEGENFSVDEGGNIVYDLLLNDTDVEGDALTLLDIEGTGGGIPFTVTSTFGREGTVIFEADASPNFVFAAGSGFDDLGEGTYDTVELDYTVSDGNGGTDVATAVIYITGVSQIEADSGTYFSGSLPTGIDIIEF